MEKVLLTLTIIVSLLGVKSTHAQSIESQQYTIIELTNRINTLEHDLEYIKLENDLNTLLSNINELSNLIHIHSITLEINIYHDNYDKKFYNSSKELYDTFVERNNHIHNEISFRQSWVKSKLNTYPFYESEQKSLKLKLDNLDRAAIKLSGTIDFYKLVLDLYKKKK